MYEERDYRKLIQGSDELFNFKVIVKETDIWLSAEKPLAQEAREVILKHRGYLESFIERHPRFLTTLTPWPTDPLAPKIVKEMIQAGQAAGVGPMAAVAGALSEAVGQELLALSKQIVVENGGDIFIRLKESVTIGLYAGKSPLSLKMGIRLPSNDQPISVCTSSGTIGHSLSLGVADAVSVVSKSCALADAAATAIANQVKTPDHIKTAIDFGKNIDGVEGLVIIINKNLGGWGAIELVRLS